MSKLDKLPSANPDMVVDVLDGANRMYELLKITPERVKEMIAEMDALKIQIYANVSKVPWSDVVLVCSKVARNVNELAFLNMKVGQFWAKTSDRAHRDTIDSILRGI